MNKTTFTQVGLDDYKCENCSAVNEFECESWDSFGGTTEGYMKCLACGGMESWADLSAIL